LFRLFTHYRRRSWFWSRRCLRSRSGRRGGSGRRRRCDRCGRRQWRRAAGDRGRSSRSLHGSQFSLQRERRGGGKVLRRVLQVMTGRKCHSCHIRLAPGRGSQHETKAGQTETVPPAHCFHASIPLCKIVEVGSRTGPGIVMDCRLQKLPNLQSYSNLRSIPSLPHPISLTRCAPVEMLPLVLSDGIGKEFTGFAGGVGDNGSELCADGNCLRLTDTWIQEAERVQCNMP